jgi:hypothetical protein
MPLYDAFISYSHAQDKPIAAALQSVIQKLEQIPIEFTHNLRA